MQSTTLRITATWVLLVLTAVLFVSMRMGHRQAMIDRATDRAEVAATQAAQTTSASVRTTFDKARAAAEQLLGGDIDDRTVANAVPLADAQLAGVFDADRRTIIAIGFPGDESLDGFTIDLGIVQEFFPGSSLGLDGEPTLAYGGVGEQGTLLTLFVPFRGDDGGNRVFATGVLFDQAVFAPYLEAGASEFALAVVDRQGNTLFSTGDRPELADVTSTSPIEGTDWQVVANATYAQLGSPLGLWWNLPFLLLLCAAIVGTLGALVTKGIRGAAEIELAYEQVAWSAHQQREFTAVVAHELRTPATTASGLAGFLASQWQRLNEDQRLDLAERVSRSTADLAHLVADLRLANGIDNGPVSVIPASRRTGELIDEALAELRLGHDRIGVTGDVDRMCVVDQRFAVRALGSVIRNAVTHGSDPVEVMVRDAGLTVDICIRDHGDGVPEDFRPLLFEPFTQARSHLRREHRGTGLGLHLVQAIVEQMGGQVQYRPVNPGSEFILTFPTTSASHLLQVPNDPSELRTS